MAYLPPCIAAIGIPCNGAPNFTCAHPHCLDRYEHKELTCHTRTIAAQSNIFTDGEPKTHAYLIVSGAVRLFKKLDNGKRQVLGFKFAGEFLELECVERHHYTAQAINNVDLRCFPIEGFHAAAATDSQFMMKLFSGTSSDLLRTRDLMLTVGQRDADGAMAAFLLSTVSKAAEKSNNDGFVSLPMGRSDIANHIGLTHETVSRVFSHFKKHKIISLRGNREVRINKAALLLALADGQKAGPRRERHH